MTPQRPVDNRHVFGRALVWLGLLVVALYYGYYAHFHSPTIAFGDDPSVYLTSAKALASGQGYRLINYPDPPIASFYPIGYPALLALLLRLFPAADPINVSGLSSAVMAYLWVVLTYLFLKRYMRYSLAGMAAIAMGLTQRVFLNVWSIMSEWPFALLVLAAVIVADRSLRGMRPTSESSDTLVSPLPSQASDSASLGFAFLAGLLITVAMLMRSMGITLVAGMAFFYAINRRWSHCAVYIAGVAVVELPWLIWNRLHHVAGGLAGYVAQYRHEATAQTPLSNLHSLLTTTTPTALFPFMDSNAWNHLAHHGPVIVLQILVGVVIIAAEIAGLLSLLRQRNVFACCCIPYLMLVLIWPWDPVRFCIPLYPLFILVAAFGIRALVATARKYRPEASASASKVRLHHVVAAVLMISIVSSLVQDAQWVRRLAHTGSLTGSDGAAEWNARLEACHYIQQHTAKNAVILTPYACATYLFTDRHTMGVPATGEELAQMLETMHGPEPVYIFAIYRTSVAEYNYGTEFGLAPVNAYASAHPGTLTRLWGDASGKMILYAVTPTR